MYKIVFSKSAEKELYQFSNPFLKRIIAAISNLEKNPRPKGCKKLVGKDEDLWRIRIGDYRVVYSIDDTILIVDIRKVGHRKNIYE